MPVDTALRPITLADAGQPTEVLVSQAMQAGPGVRELEGLLAVIQGGIGQGITLGSIQVVDDNQKPIRKHVGRPGGIDPCAPCKPGDGNIPPDGGKPGTHNVSAGPLFEIYIERNRIRDMGLDGIGVAMGRTSYVQDDIAKGRLVVPFKIALPADAGFYLVSPEGVAEPPKLRAFRQWLIASAKNGVEKPAA